MATQAQAKQLQKKQTSAARTVNRSKAKRQISRKNTPIAPAYLQAKLNISSPDDPHEREADQVADSVMRMPVQRSVTGSINRASLKPGITPINRAISAEISRDSLKPGEQLIHRDSLKPGNESIQRKADASTSISSNTTENKINAKLGQGDKLPATVRESMEARFGHDFSEVRIHSDNEAAELSQNIEAKAFTVGNDIFFASGQFEPNSDEGQRLLAHELTHVVQQSGAGNTGVAQQKIQRFSFRGAWDAVSGAVSSAVEFVGDSISAGLDWIKEHLSGLVSSMPGYSLLAVMLGEDPITGAAVARTGRNFIEAGLDVIPNGAVLKAKLEEKGALAEAASWLDEQIAILEFSPSAILRSLGNFFSGLSLSDIASPAAVFSRLKNIVVPPIVRLATFAITVASKLLEIVKNYILDNLVTFVKEQTRAYPLLTVILGKDPITDEQVDRTPIALLRGFMLLSESGEEQLRQMEESGSLQRAADWVNGALERLNITWDIIKQIFINAWEAITFQSVFPNPLVAFTRIVNIIAPPALRIINFVIEVALKVLGFIKDALISRLVSFARGTRGYTLLTVILGKDPFSGEQVERSTENIIKGFMLLTSGGEEQFKQMKETGAITRMSARIETAIATLAFTWAYIRGLFTTAWESFTLSMLAQPLQAFARILAVFADPFLRLVSFVIEIVKVVVEVILRVMNFPINLVNNIITKAMQAFTNIKRNPIGFLMNLLRAVRQGFEQFFGNITDHLISGVVDWLFGQLSDAGITPPQDLSFRSILGLVLEVLNLTIERIWEKLEERIGPERMARVRSMIDRLTGAWAFVKDVVTRGPIAIWEYIQERLSSLWDTVLESIRNWIVTRIIQRVTTKLLSMLDPTGIMAVVNGFMAFFNAVQSFIRYLQEMLQIVNSFVEGVAEIAAGSVASAANFLENALGRAIPIAIGFLANQVGLSDLGRRIGEMIGRVRDMVDQALTWLIDKAVNAGSSFMGMLGIGSGQSDATETASTWWEIERQATIGDASYRIFFQGNDQNAELRINDSGIKTIAQWRDETRESLSSDQNRQAHDEVLSTATQITHLTRGNTEGINIQILNTRLDNLMSSVQRVKLGNDPQARLQAAQIEVQQILSRSPDTNQISTHFEQIKQRYNLATIEFDNMGAANASVHMTINPESHLVINGDQALMVGSGARVTGSTNEVITTDVKWKSQSLSLGGVTAIVGKEMTAEPLANDHAPGQDSGRNSGQNLLMAQLPGGTTGPARDRYIKGHMLNDNVGGPADDRNLFPITAQANSDHKNWVESYVKEDIARGYVGRYSVQANHSTPTKINASDPNSKYKVDGNFICNYSRLNSKLQPVGSPVSITIPSVFNIKPPRVDHRDEFSELYGRDRSAQVVAGEARVEPNDRYTVKSRFGSVSDSRKNE